MNYIQFCCLILITFNFSCRNVENKKAAPSKDSKPMMVDAIIATSESSTGKISTTGTILANEEVEIKTEISGKITSIQFKEGQPVAKGQLLVKLYDEDLIAQMKKLEIEIKQAKDKENRQKQLLTSTAISEEEYEMALTNLNLLKASADILKTSIDKTKIIAPFSGIIGLKNVSPGAYISTSTVIATIQNTQPLKLDFSVPEKYHLLIKNGNVVEFNLAGIEGTQKATVYAIEPKIDPVTRTIKVRATFNNYGNRFSPGSFADVTIPIGNTTSSIMIPTIAYIPDISGAQVFISKGGKASNVAVKSGLRTEGKIQILDGIKEGDTVLTSGILQIKPNMPVDVRINNQVD